MFLEKHCHVPGQFQLHGLAAIGRCDNDPVNELAHQLDGSPRGFVTLQWGTANFRNALLIALSRPWMESKS